MDAALTLEPAPLDHVKIAVAFEALKNFDQRSFTLMADHDIDERLVQRLRGAKAGMPSAEDDGQIGTGVPHDLARLDGVVDHGAGEKRNPETEAAGDFAGEHTEVVAMKRGIDHDRLITRLTDRSGETEQAQWRSKQLAGIRRLEEHNTPGTGVG
jgi:hypothetical protein